MKRTVRLLATGSSLWFVIRVFELSFCAKYEFIPSGLCVFIIFIWCVNFTVWSPVKNMTSHYKLLQRFRALYRWINQMLCQPQQKKWFRKSISSLKGMCAWKAVSSYYATLLRLVLPYFVIISPLCNTCLILQ